jgi:hypothetical protein
MSLDTRIKDMYVLGVEITIVFEILRHFLFRKKGPSCMVMTYIPLDVP